MGTLDGRSVVVTGASSGIGEAVARRLITEGALVTIGSRSEPVVAGATWVPTNVADPSAADALIDAAVDANGGLDVLVNNAGVQVVKTLADTTDGEFDHVMDVNVRGVFNCCRAAIRWMSDNGGGSIINVGSVAADAADHSMAVYNASKGAVHLLTRSIAIDHGRDGVRCNAICPGWIAAALAEMAFEQSDDPTIRRPQGPEPWAGIRWVVWARPRTWPTWRPGWPPTRRPSSRGACSRSTAASPRRAP